MSMMVNSMDATEIKYPHVNRHKKILVLLEKARKSNKGKTFSTTEIAQQTEYSVSMIIRDMKDLFDLGCVNRYPSPSGGHAYVYTFKSYSPVKLRIKRERDEIRHVEFTADDIYELLQKWSMEPWRPKIFISARNLPQGLADLYRIALDAKYGAAVKQMEINDIRQGMNEFKQDLEKVLSVVKSMLSKSELWNTNTLPLFLLPDTDEGLLRQNIEDVINKN